jgi:hypothetical protein
MIVPASKLITVSIASFLIASLLSSFAYGQELTGQVATNVEVADSQASAGDILSITSNDTLVRSSSSYDKNLFGVVVEDPAMVLNKETDKTASVLSQGEAQVKVTNKGGDITVGDLITSSDEAGVGQKATSEGVVLGKALGSYSDSSVGTIPILINIHHQSQISGGSLGSLWDRIMYFTSSSIEEPENFQMLLRYLLALILASSSFILGFVFAARAIRVGLIAVGRNPLARGVIQANMVFNLMTVLALAAAGVGLAMFIIFYR